MYEKWLEEVFEEDEREYISKLSHMTKWEVAKEIKQRWNRVWEVCKGWENKESTIRANLAPKL